MFESLNNDTVYLIISYCSIRDILNISSSSKSYYVMRENMYHIFVKNNPFLKQYLQKRKMCLKSTIETSSFTKLQFFKMFDNIDIDKRPQKFQSICHNIEELCEDEKAFHLSKKAIDSSFELFKIIGSFAMQKFKFYFKDSITSHLLTYFSNIYDARHPRVDNICKDIFNNFITKKDKIAWQLLNVNIYYIYENVNLLKFAKRSCALKNNMINFDEGNIFENPENNLSTIYFTIHMFDFLPSVEIKIYFMYQMFKFVTKIVEDNLMCDSKFITFQKTILKKIEIFEFDLNCQFRSSIPCYMRKMMIEKVKNLETLIRLKIANL